MKQLKSQVQGLGAMLLLGICGCVHSERTNFYARPDENKPAVDEKYRLTADREKFAELRQEVPAQSQQQNDELAFVLQLMAESKLPPAEVRAKFDSALRKKRNLWQRDLQKEREIFNKSERSKRDEFLKNSDRERKDFLRLKSDREKTDEFFAQQAENRKVFFENQREKRNDFESDVLERRRNFEDYVRESTNSFQQEWRAYQKSYAENKNNNDKNINNNKKAQKDLQSQEVRSFLEDLERMQSLPGVPLETGE